MIDYAAMDYFDNYQKAYGFRARWAYYKAKDLNDLSGIPVGSTLVTYYSPATEKLDGPTWLDLWKAVDKIVQKTGDYHIFFEGVRRQKKGIYLVELGS